MKCVFCNSKKEMKVIVEDHRYVECGLDNIVIKNMKKYICTNCGEEYYNFSNPWALHRIIAKTIANGIDHLNNKEFRFLRKHMGFSGEFFAKLVGVSRETVSRWENGKAAIPRYMELLIKMLVINYQPDRDHNLHDQMLNGKKKLSSFKLQLEYNKNKQWEVKKAA